MQIQVFFVVDEVEESVDLIGVETSMILVVAVVSVDFVDDVGPVDKDDVQSDG